MNVGAPSGGGDDRRPPVTPQMALRVAVLGGIAVVLFATVFFRLWYLEVLSGGQYVSQANDNRVREVRVQAPRGDIVDRNGRTLVSNRQATVVQVTPGELPAPGPKRRALYARLGKVLQERPESIQNDIIEQRKALPYAPATIKTDVPQSVLDYLKERKTDFPGVDTPLVYLRRYPFGTLAAQMLGNVGQINPTQLHEKHFRGVKEGTIVGQGGVEFQYDRYLRGRDGAKLLQVNALGDFRGVIRQRQPVAGRSLKLTLDLGLQKVGQQALLRAGGGKPGAFVAMDPSSGEVLGLGSYPSYDPTIFTKPIATKTYNALNSEANGAPLFDRAIGGLYPTGSTFKPITAMAALTHDVITPSTTISDSGCLAVGVQKFCNTGKTANGVLALPRAIQVSSDVFFYTLGRDLNPLPKEPLQAWARAMGLGSRTGIDLPGEFAGLVPDRAWRAAIGRKELACRKREHKASCGISDARPWSVGDNINLSVGQGDVQASPLQMAVAYSTLVNGGKVPRPHVAREIDDAQGRLVQKISPAPSRRIKDFPAQYRQAILEGLHLAASAPGGTSEPVWRGWNQDRYPVYGKTGTAERPPHPDQSWYLCWVKDQQTGKSIVVAVTIEGGGFGAEAAAPAARQIVSEYFTRKAGDFVPGTSKTR